MSKEGGEKIFIGLFLIVATLVGMIFVLWFNSRFIENDIKDEDIEEEIINIDVEAIKPPDEVEEEVELTDLEKYDSYKKISMYPDGIETPDNYIANASESLTNAGRKIRFVGEIEDAYIYIKAGANDGEGNFTSIQKEFDGIWFYIVNNNFNGGQLDLSRSKFSETSELTELLYNIKSIPVAENLEQYRIENFKTLNLLGELKDNRFIGTLVSTMRYGKILELSIGYKCVEGSSCTIKKSY